MKCVIAAIACSLAAAGCSSGAKPAGGRPYQLNGPLIPARVTMVAAWDVPQNPLTDSSLDDSRLSKEIRRGYQIFVNTPTHAAKFTGGQVSCTNCHMNAGQRERSLPLVGISGQFPEYNRRAGRFISLEDRIVDCFLRSENATGAAARAGEDAEAPTTGSSEVLAVASYLSWLSRGTAIGKAPSWRGQNAIAQSALIPVDQIDREKGSAIFRERCTSCHGEDGQGKWVGDKRPGPLWGPESWNDGAGAARIYTLAGIVRYTMPYLDPGSLTDEEAQQVAAFINAQPRPAYPFKARDYLTDSLPPDSVYYPRRSPAQ